MPRRPIVQSNLRISPELHSRLERAAKRNNSSINKEMSDRLAASFAPDKLTNLDKVAGDIEQAVANLKTLIRVAKLDRAFSVFLQHDLGNAAEALIKDHTAENVARLRSTVETIAALASRPDPTAEIAAHMAASAELRAQAEVVPAAEIAEHTAKKTA